MSGSSSDNQEDQNKGTMWTLVYKLDEDEYDCVPNVWLLSPEQCYYPPDGESLASLKKLARLGNAPDIDWPVKSIKIMKRNFENFDRCVMDACRLQSNKRTLTSSENELNKRRSVKVNSKFLDSTPAFQKESVRKNKSVKKSFDFSQMPSLAKAAETSKENGQVFEMIRTPSPVKQDRRLSCNPSVDSASKNPGFAQRKSGCHLRPNLKHTCIFERGEINAENMAMQLCSISRSLYSLTEEVKHLHAELSCRLPADFGTKDKAGSESDDSDNETEHNEISNRFPFRVLNDLMAFNETLQDLETQKKKNSSRIQKYDCGMRGQDVC